MIVLMYIWLRILAPHNSEICQRQFKLWWY